MGKPDPGPIWSGKIFAPESFSSCRDFKNGVFKKPDFDQKNRILTKKTGTGCPGRVETMWELNK